MNLRTKQFNVNLIVLILPTLGIFAVSLWFTLVWRYPNGLDSNQLALHIKLFGWISLLWLAINYGFGLLDLWSYKTMARATSALVGASITNLFFAFVLFYLQPNLILTPRRFLFVDVAVVFVLSFVWQAFIRSIARKAIQSRVYLLDLEKEFAEIKTELDRTGLGSDLMLHAISKDQLMEQEQQLCKKNESALFVLPMNTTFSASVLKTLETLHACGISFIKFDAFYEDLFRRVYTPNLTEWWFLENTNRNKNGLYPAFKRLGDVFVGLVIFFVFAITFPFVALAIKLTSRGPIFFKQSRRSTHGSTFTIYKYRTMKSGTATNTWTEKHDSRITPVGNILRKLRIDELPQWMNLIRGDMSFVGPRPEQEIIVEQLRTEIPFFDSRHTVVPGLTGWAQLHVYAGTTEESKRKLQYDLYYLKHRSFLFDLEIILKTISHIFFLSGT